MKTGNETIFSMNLFPLFNYLLCESLNLLPTK